MTPLPHMNLLNSTAITRTYGSTPIPAFSRDVKPREGSEKMQNDWVKTHRRYSALEAFEVFGMFESEGVVLSHYAKGNLKHSFPQLELLS